MAKYKVLRPIEHDLKLYIPTCRSGPATVKSVGHGQDIPVDRTGVVEIKEVDAGAIPDYVLEPIRSSTGARDKKAG